MIWQPISTAPKDEILLSYWGDLPVFIAWSDGVATTRKRYHGRWPFRRIEVITEKQGGWRVLMPLRSGESYGLHGNYAPYAPEYWMRVPEKWWPMTPSDPVPSREHEEA